MLKVLFHTGLKANSIRFVFGPFCTDVIINMPQFVLEKMLLGKTAFLETQQHD